MLRTVWIVMVSTIATAILGGLYDYFRPFFADVTRGSGAEAWFTTGNTLYLMPWLFAIAGLAGAVIAVLMSGTAKRAGQGAPAPAKSIADKKGKEKQSAVKGKAAADAVPGMPSFDFDAALVAAKPSAAPPEKLEEIPAATPVATAEPPQGVSP